ncbi:MAG: hypothetical protein KF819_02645 [Labilithrix sp.]|nr:hypothetical protein [Labilithrix sp.]
MKRGGWIVTAALLAVPALASAATGKVVVAGAPADAVANGVQKELGAMGFEPVRVDDPAGCAKDAVAGWVERLDADGAACSEGGNVHVWVVSSAGLRLADVVKPRDDDSRASEMVAVRAAEIARASLQIASDDRAAPSMPPPPPAWSAEPPPSIKTLTFGPREPAESPRRTRSRAGPPKYAPTFMLGAGMSALVGADLSAPAFGVTAEIGVSRRIALGARAELPVSTDSRFASSGASSRVAPSLLALSLMVPLTDTESVVVPRVGGGLGVAWLRAEPGSDGFAPARVPSTTTTITTQQRDDAFSAAAYMDAALAVRVVGPIHLTLDGVLGTAMQRMVVRVQGEHVAYWGVPFGVVSLRMEAVVK